MSLEGRIAEALHATDSFEPSSDLFSRVHRSIEEAQAHRRRVQQVVVLGSGGLVAAMLLVAVVAERGTDGGFTVPRWSVQIIVAALLVGLLVTLGPALRRLGAPLLDDVFHLSPPTGERFAQLLDIAYYLFFGGLIVSGVETRGLAEYVGLSSDAVTGGVTRIAGFLVQLGVVHTMNIASLPMIGLLFGSLTRRTRRQHAGVDGPPESPKARKADTLAQIVVMTTAALMIAATLTVVAFIVVSIGLS